MKDPKKKVKSLQNDDLQSVLTKYEAMERKQTPDMFKIGRSLLQQIVPIERNLFDKMESSEEEKGAFRIAGLVHKITEKDLYACAIALGQINSNLSVKSGYTATHTGMSDTLALAELSKELGKPVLMGDICFSLNEFCRYAYGTTDPSSKERKAAEALIKTFHDTPVEIEYRDGKKIDAYLATIVQKEYNDKDGAKFYHLHLHPIFCDIVSKGFALLRQDAIALMRGYCIENKKKLTHTHYRLLGMLAQQKLTQDGKARVFQRSALELLSSLGLEREFYKNRARALSTLEDVINSVQATGIITRYEIVRKRLDGKEIFDSVNFHLNPRYAKSSTEGHEDSVEDAEYTELPPGE